MHFVGTYWKARNIGTLEVRQKQRVEFRDFREKKEGSFYMIRAVFRPLRYNTHLRWLKPQTSLTACSAIVLEDLTYPLGMPG